MLFRQTLAPWVALLRWNKPSGRLILLIPAGWSLWLTPNAPPSAALVVMIVLGGLAVSGAGCIANDLWDRRIDRNVERTKQRPLAQGSLSVAQAVVALIVLLSHQFDRGAELAGFRAQPLPFAGLSRPAADLDLPVR